VLVAALVVLALAAAVQSWRLARSRCAVAELARRLADARGALVDTHAALLTPATPVPAAGFVVPPPPPAESPR
jgi:hypothetical protein